MMETLLPIQSNVSTTSSTPSSPANSHHSPTLKNNLKYKKIDSVSATECTNCGTTTTPLWRRGPNGETICNACGLYLKARNTLRPPTLKRTVHKKTNNTNSNINNTNNNNNTNKNDCGGGTCPGGGQCNGTGGSSSCAGCPAYNQHQVNRQALICANCRTTTTPLWRRDEQGNTICNACGLYYKLHNVHRPVSMKRSVIKRRKRIIVAQGSDEEESELIELEESTIDPSSTTTLTGIESIKKEKQLIPEIEDYVVLKKKKIELPIKKQHNYYLNHSHLPTDQIYNNNNNNNSFYSKSTYPDQSLIHPFHSTQPNNSIDSSNTFHPSSSPTPPPPHTGFLPPISSERQSYRLDSLFNRRDSNSSSNSSLLSNNNNNSTVLPPLSLPPLTPPSSQSIRQSNQLSPLSSPPIIQPTQNKYELADFDQALDRLEHLRRQVRPEQAYALSQLTQSLSDLASKAEAILSLDSLAYGR